MQDPFAYRLSSFLLSRPKTLAALMCAVVVGGVSLLPFLRVEAGQDVFFDKTAPLHLFLDEVNGHFVNDDLLFVVYRTDDVFSRENLGLIRELGRRIEDLKLSPGFGDPVWAVEEVVSLATVKDLDGSGTDLRTVPLVPEPVPSGAGELEGIRARAFNNPLIAGNLVTPDGRLALLTVRLPDDFKDDRRSGAVDSIRGILRETERRHASIRFLLAGESVINADMARYQAEDLGNFIPLAYAIITVLLFLFVRRLLGVVLALSMVTICLVSGMALLVAIGSSINNCSVMLTPVILALSVAMLLHYMSELGKNAGERRGQNVPLTTLGELIAPVFMAAITTGVGFACLSVSDVPAIREFGAAAGGSMLVSFAIVTVMFALFVRWRPAEAIVSPKSIALSPVFDRALSRLAGAVITRRWTLLASSVLYIALVAAGISKIQVDNNDLELFDEEAPVRRAMASMDDDLGGSTLVVVSIRSVEEEHFIRPRALLAIEGLSVFLKQDLGVQRVTSVVDYIKLMHREFYGGDPAHHGIPDSSDKVAQLLMLNGDDTLSEYIDESRGWVRVVARCGIHSSIELERLHRRLEEYLADNFLESDGYTARSTGLSRLAADMINQIIRSQTLGLALACALIFGLMFILFRSFKAGLVSMLPNMIPVATNLGLMGWLGVRLDAATVMISTVALGIAVDDTVHFVQHLRRRLRAHGDLERGVRETFHTKGPAIIWTSMVISLGFAVVLVSNFAPTRNFGLLICAAMITALLGDLIMLPSIVLCTRSRLGIKKRG